jgi:hypothetical protein
VDAPHSHQARLRSHARAVQFPGFITDVAADSFSVSVVPEF